MTSFVRPSVFSARFRISMMSSLEMGSSTSTRDRESRGVMTSKLGFSVVAPIRVIKPDSTWGKNASCWALLKRWISSTNNMVRAPKFQFCLALSTTASTSFLPAVTALSSTKSAFISFATIRARVVFPVPGGPQRIRLTGSLFLTICFKISPSASRCDWPTTSDNF